GLLDRGQDLVLRVGADGDADAQLLPLQVQVRAGVGRVGEDEDHALARLRQRRRLDRRLRDDLRRLGDLGAPDLGVGAEYDPPRRLARYSVERVGAGLDRRAAEGEVAARDELRGFIGARAPRLVERDQIAPDLAVLDAGARVDDGEVRQADALLDAGVRARQRRLDLGARGAGESEDGTDGEDGRWAHGVSFVLANGAGRMLFAKTWDCARKPSWQELTLSSAP